MNKFLLLPVLFVSFFSCAKQKTDTYIFDAGIKEIPDSNFIEDHPCQYDLMWSDFWNCGECDNTCPTTDADQCVGGICSCGGGEVCSTGFDCRHGSCVESDLNGKVCEFDSECFSSYECIEGHCTFIMCSPEECDGIDNDCDGNIDEDNSNNPLSEWCFSGRENQLHRPCQSGARICLDGSWSECFGEVPPGVEQGLNGCDGIDNDCDGCVDGVLSANNICERNVPGAYDILYIIDTSASMDFTIASVVEATNNYSASFVNNEEFKFALATFPHAIEDGDYHTEDPVLTLVVTDFTDLITFQGFLAPIIANANSSHEPNWDAGYEVGNEELQPLSWRENSVRIVIMFTDEMGQSYRNPLISEQDMCDSFIHGEVVAIFETQENFQDFDNCGQMFSIINNDVLMETELESLIADPCQ